jgi:hypothetical protein
MIEYYFCISTWLHKHNLECKKAPSRQHARRSLQSAYILSVIPLWAFSLMNPYGIPLYHKRCAAARASHCKNAAFGLAGAASQVRVVEGKTSLKSKK